MVEAVTNSSSIDSISNIRNEEGSETRTRGHLLYLDVVRAYAIILVLVGHVSGGFANLYHIIEPNQWWVLNGMTAMMKGGVALFVMTSGMLLLGSKRQQTLGEFFSKRVRKVIVPFIAWAMIHFAWRIFLSGETVTFQQALYELIEGPVYPHLWFIYMILGMYLITPILKIYVQNADRQNLTYFLGLWFILNGILPLTDQFLGFNVGIWHFMAINYVGYFVMGYYLRDITLNNYQLNIAMITVAICILFNQTVTYFLTVNAEGRYVNYFFDYSAFSVMLLTISLFLTLKSLPYDRIFKSLPFLKNPITILGEYSFGVFLVHFILLNSIRSGHFFDGFRLSALSFHPFIAVPLLSLLTIIGSVGIVGVMRRIPIVREVVP